MAFRPRDFLLLICIICTSAFGAGRARVTFIKGGVTALPLGKMKASNLKKGQWVLEGTSIVTSSKSFVRFVFKDKTSLNIGPNSKIVLSKVKQNSGHVINLLTGIMKANVQKNKKKQKNKLVVKTGSAVMGVRGTKFQSTYNPVNKSTSLVTVEGKVAMVKANDTPVESVEAVIENSPDVVEVPAGRYSGAIAQVDKATVPVKIAPVQYNAIAKSMGSQQRAQDVMKPKVDGPAPQGFEDKASGKFAPKAGGYLDFATGIYVPPPEDAKLDKKTGTYESNSIGKINKRTGDYIPPKGIRVDEKKGFVLDSKNDSKSAPKNIEKTLADLNQSVKKHIPEEENLVTTKPKDKQDKRWKWPPKKHLLGIEILPFSETIEVDAKASGDKEKVSSESAHFTLFIWQQVWNEKWSTKLVLGAIDYEADSSDQNILEFDNDGDEGYTSLGLSYRFNEKWVLNADLAERTYYYTVPLSGTGANGKKDFELLTDNMVYIDLGVNYHRPASGKWHFIFAGNLVLFADNQVPTPNLAIECFENCSPARESADTFGIGLDASALYHWRKNIVFSSKLWLETLSAEADSIDYKRQAYGLGLNLTYSL